MYNYFLVKICTKCILYYFFNLYTTYMLVHYLHNTFRQLPGRWTLNGIYQISGIFFLKIFVIKCSFIGLQSCLGNLFFAYIGHILDGFDKSLICELVFQFFSTDFLSYSCIIQILLLIKLAFQGHSLLNMIEWPSNCHYKCF